MKFLKRAQPTRFPTGASGLNATHARDTREVAHAGTQHQTFAPALGVSHSSTRGQTLQQELQSTRHKIRALTQERESLSLAAYQGDAQALSQIAAIDLERVKLVAFDETLNAAIRTEKAQVRVTDWQCLLPKMGRLMRTELSLFYINATPGLARMLLSRQAHDVAELKLTLQEVEVKELSAARQAANEVLPRLSEKVTWIGGDQADENAARAQKKTLDAQRKQAIEDAAKALLSDANNHVARPAEFEAALVAARARLKVDLANVAHNTKVITRQR